jgi:hypothetical protein
MHAVVASTDCDWVMHLRYRSHLFVTLVLSILMVGGHRRVWLSHKMGSSGPTRRKSSQFESSTYGEIEEKRLWYFLKEGRKKTRSRSLLRSRPDGRAAMRYGPKELAYWKVCRIEGLNYT